MTTEDDVLRLLRLHQDEVLYLLEARGLDEVRVPTVEHRRASADVELLVTPDQHVDLGDLIEAAEALSEYAGATVRLISSRSAKGIELRGGAQPL